MADRGGQSPVQPSRARRGAKQAGLAAPGGLTLPDANGPQGFCVYRRIHLKKRQERKEKKSEKHKSVATNANEAKA